MTKALQAKDQPRVDEIKGSLDILVAEFRASPTTERDSYRPRIEPLAREYHRLTGGWYTYRHVTDRTASICTLGRDPARRPQ